MRLNHTNRCFQKREDAGQLISQSPACIMKKFVPIMVNC